LKICSANNKSRAQEYQKKSPEQTIVQCRLVNVAPCFCKPESQRFQLSSRTYKSKDSKAILTNKSHRNSSSIEEDRTFSDQRAQRCLEKLTFKQNIATPTVKHFELIKDEKYLDQYFIYPENGSNEIFLNNRNNSPDAKKCLNRQCSDMLKSLTSDDQRSRNQSFTELPKVNDRSDEVEANTGVILLRTVPQNTKNNANNLNMDPEKIRSFNEEAFSICQHPYFFKTNNEKKNNLDNMPVSLRKLLGNIGGNLSSERNSRKPTKNSSYPRKFEWKIEEAKSGKHYVQHRLKPIVHLVPVVRKNEPKAMSSPQKEMKLRKFTGEKASRSLSNIFMNPVYTDAGTGTIPTSRCGQQPEIIVPRWRTPPLVYGGSRDNLKNLNANVLYEHTTNLPFCLPYPGNNNGRSRKALRRFI
uniref:Chromosome 1 open reading frame 141 n=1 Tax=Elaeophora elaphi TaxID=1147741 RepID=A0A0R3RXC2_9BILA